MGRRPKVQEADMAGRKIDASELDLKKKQRHYRPSKKGESHISWDKRSVRGEARK